MGIVNGYCGNDFDNTYTKLTGHKSGVLSVADLGGGRLASGSWDKMIRIWNFRKGGECEQTKKGHSGDVTSVCALGGRLVSGSNDRTIRIWDLDKANKRGVQKLTGHGRGVISVCALALMTKPFAYGIRPREAHACRQ